MPFHRGFHPEESGICRAARLAGAAAATGARRQATAAPERLAAELRNLINASPITEFQLEQKLIGKGIMEPTRNLESLSDEKLLEIQMMFMALAAEIVDAP
jgi:hypothetical protein